MIPPDSTSPLTRRGLLAGGAASLAASRRPSTPSKARPKSPTRSRPSRMTRDPAKGSASRPVKTGTRNTASCSVTAASRSISRCRLADSGGGMFIVEHTDTKKSGPPRHIHHDQDEWFYVVKGDYIVEVGGERFTLGPGDSVMGPRKIPHAWAFVGEGTGKLIITFQPAGKMEAFFNKIAPMTEFPPREEMEKMFREHGLQLTGPPLLVG